MKKLFSREGFTLIEMIVVIGVLGIIATVLLITVNPIDQLKKSNDADRKNDLAQLKRALDLYYQDNGSYPPSSADFKILSGATTLAWGASWSPYIAALPKDPLPSHNYVYYMPASSNGQTYYLYANLERGGKDAQACNTTGAACTSLTAGTPGFPPTGACGATCNYGVSSTNVTP